MKIRPLHDWAVIQPSTGNEMTAGGLHIPDSAKGKPQEGVVEAIGPGAYEAEKRGKKKEEEGKKRKFIPTSVKPGDHVIYERYAGQNYKINGEERILVRERDILGILLEKPLQIPSTTSVSGATSLEKSEPLSRGGALRPGKTAGTAKKPEREAAVKSSPKKKAVPKAGKSAKKTSGSKAKGKKTGKKK